MKGKITGLILDYGCVISEPQNTVLAREMAEMLNSPYDDFTSAYYKHRPCYDSGCTASEYWSRIGADLGCEPSERLIDQLKRKDCISWDNQNKQMLDFLKEKRPSIPTMAVLSNMPWDHLSYIRINHTWFLPFDKLFFSCETGRIKPERDTFLHCLKTLNLDAEECLFVDDNPENINTAHTLGMETHLFKTFKGFIQDWGEQF